MGFLAIVNAYTMRISLSVAITEMVNSTHSAYDPDACPDADGNSSSGSQSVSICHISEIVSSAGSHNWHSRPVPMDSNISGAPRQWFTIDEVSTCKVYFFIPCRGIRFLILFCTFFTLLFFNLVSLSITALQGHSAIVTNI